MSSRSLKLWLVLRMYGVKKLRELVRHHIGLAEWFAAAVAADGRFEIAAPPRFGLTCFRLRDLGREGNLALLEKVNSSGMNGLTRVCRQRAII
jgi:glutamate/tyrosine decarboxylase-like PLP-dependent enzyme